MTQELRGYRIISNPGPRPVREGEEQEEKTKNPDTPADSPVREKPTQPLNWLKRLKSTYRAPSGSPPLQLKGDESQQHLQLDRPQLD